MQNAKPSPVDTIIATNSPLALDAAFERVADQLALSKLESTHTIAVSSIFNDPQQIKELPGFKKLRLQCAQNGHDMAFEYAIVKDHTDSKSGIVSTVIIINPDSAFRGLREKKSRQSTIPTYVVRH